MPRSGKGNKQQGQTQTAYGNRTDLMNRGPEMETPAPGDVMGERLPEQNPIDAERGNNFQQMSKAPAIQEIERPRQFGQMFEAQQRPEPGQISFLHPSERPHEPITAGLDEDRLQPMTMSSSLRQMLDAAAASPHASPVVRQLAEHARRANI